MYLGAWERGLNFDWSGVYEYLRKNAMDVNGPRQYLAEYLKQGWISDFIPDREPSPPYADGKAGAATTLEYSWDDHAMALFATKLGKEDDYQMFLSRAHNYRNVFDPSVGFMRGRTEDGKWISPFDPREPYYNFMMKEAGRRCGWRRTTCRDWLTCWAAAKSSQRNSTSSSALRTTPRGFAVIARD
jgi:putative alpha-1,2-mannosidase